MPKKAEDSLMRVERHLIHPSSPWFSMIGGFCHLAKNLYNHGNYLVRNRFIKNGQWMRYDELDKALKTDVDYPDYRAMPTAQAAQQVLRLLDKNWKSFFAAIKDWKEHKEKYLGRPKLPKYKEKNGKGGQPTKCPYRSTGWTYTSENGRKCLYGSSHWTGTSTQVSCKCIREQRRGRK